MIQNPDIKIFLTDVDGTMTDGARYISENKEETKRFHIPDGLGLLCLRHLGVKTGMITTDDGPIAAERAKSLKLDYTFLGAYNKLKVVQELSRTSGVAMENIAFIGDDLNDHALLSAVGFPGCPGDAQGIIKKIPRIFVSPSRGGFGAVRDFVNHLAGEDQMLEAWNQFAKNR